MRKNQKGEFLSSRVRYIAIGAVRPNPQRPAAALTRRRCGSWRTASAPTGFYSR